MTVDISVVIVSYNVAALLGRCLDSVTRSLERSEMVYELVVVDNASTDSSVGVIRNRFSQVLLIENPTNRGFAAATNQGIARCSGRCLFLLNPDTEVLGDAPARLLAFMDAHPRVGLATGQLINPDGTLQHGAFMFPNLWMSFFDFFPLNHRLTGSSLNGRYPLEQTAPFEIDHPLGASMMVRREAMEQVGSMDEAFFMYCEEIDWCIRMKKSGWSIYCLPNARIIHHGGQSTRQTAPAMFAELHKSRSLLFRKHYSPFFRWAHRRIVRLGVRRALGRLESRCLPKDDAKSWREAYETVLAL